MDGRTTARPARKNHAENEESWTSSPERINGMEMMNIDKITENAALKLGIKIEGIDTQGEVSSKVRDGETRIELDKENDLIKVDSTMEKVIADNESSEHKQQKDSFGLVGPNTNRRKAVDRVTIRGRGEKRKNGVANLVKVCASNLKLSSSENEGAKEEFAIGHLLGPINCEVIIPKRICADVRDKNEGN